MWRRQLSSPAQIAKQSPDGSLIASTARYDRLVKIWKRLSFGDGNVRFDPSYLPHPSIVTSFEWKETQEQGHDGRNVLYTICSDGKARIWASINPHGLQVLQIWAEIDLLSSIQPRHLTGSTNNGDRYVLFVNGHDFKNAIGNVKASGNSTPVLEHLVEAVESVPDLCIVLDRRGHMCVWGLNSVGNKARTPTDIFNMVYVENVNIFATETPSPAELPFHLLSFCDLDSPTFMSVILHTCEGSISWFRGGLLDIFDPSHRGPRFRKIALWTGHEGIIKKINRNNDGHAIVSRTSANDALVWRQSTKQDDIALSRCSSLSTDERIYRSCLLGNGAFVANLHSTRIMLWETTGSVGQQVASCDYQINGKPLCLIQLAAGNESPSTKYIATISSAMSGIVWRANTPQLEALNGTAHHVRASIEQFCTFDLGTKSTLAYVVPVDPAGSIPVISGFLDTFAKDVALSCTTDGMLYTWATKVEQEHNRVEWLVTAQVNTGIPKPALASGSSIRKVALVDSSREGLSIWDMRNAQLEYENVYPPGESIQDLDWTSTPDEQSILAIGFPHKVLILAQIRYDYLDQKPSWATIREIRIRESTPHPIGDSTWLGSGSLVIGVGTQLFVYDKFITANDENVKDLAISTSDDAVVDLFDVVTLLNGPLPLFHPQFLSQCILAGKLPLVQKVIVNLNKQLKYYTEGDGLDSFVSIDLEECFVEMTVSATC